MALAVFEDGVVLRGDYSSRRGLHKMGVLGAMGGISTIDKVITLGLVTRKVTVEQIAELLRPALGDRLSVTARKYSIARRPEPPQHALTYKPGLDGVRAIAVVAVLFFHGGFAWPRAGTWA